MNTDKNVRVLVVAPGASPEIREVPDVLADYQAIVGGYLEPTYIGNDLVMLYDEDGLSKGLPPNRVVCNREIAGTFFFVGRKRSLFVSLTDAQLELVYGILAHGRKVS